MNISKVFNIDSNIDIQNIMYDSRIKIENSIFFAIKGKINDGHKFIDKAIENGAICIVHSDEVLNKQDNVLYIKTSDVTSYYVRFCNAMYDYPCEKLNCIGITGTNGKTTIAWIIRNIISKFEKCGYIGTLGYYYDTIIESSNLNLTTPKSDELFRICREMLNFGCKSLILEASSEGLLTRRLDDVYFSTAVFNNLTSDHMDIHGNMDDYFKAKCLLFDKLKKDGVSIINIDDEYGNKLINYTKSRIVTYGIDNDADYKAINIILDKDHSEFDLIYLNNSYHIYTNMNAKFNIYNLLAVIAVLNENGYEIKKILPYLKDIELCPGRCELVKAGQDFNVVVDFAFTTNSFVKVFNYAESITEKGSRIIAVFGAAGNRDHTRRPGTAGVADKRADYTILTYDDPFSEDMMEICLELKSYFKRINPEIIIDRYEAIKKAVNMAEKGDTILILGKGSDKFFSEASGRAPWMSDVEAAKKAIKERNS